MSTHKTISQVKYMLLAFIFVCYGAKASEIVFYTGKSDKVEKISNHSWTATGDVNLLTKEQVDSGWYVFDIEYKTEGFGWAGNFGSEVRDTSWKKRYSPWQIYPAQASWSPMRIFCHVTQNSKVLIRFCDWKNTEGAAKLSIRNPKLTPFKWVTGENVLPNATFDKGTPGGQPAQWQWKYNMGKEGNYALTANKSFSEGSYVLRISSDAEKPRTLTSRKIPLPANGKLSYSVWVKGNTEETKFGIWIICDGWKYKVNHSDRTGKQWKKFTVSLPVPEGKSGSYFWVRLDVPQGNNTVEFAGGKLVWDGVPVAEQNPLADALAAGWQGVPGDNLILNPDMELGGMGYFYEFSWANDMRGYAKLYDSEPVQLLEGKGVDGSTCAFVKKTSIRSYCFPVKRGKTYTVSLDLRAPEGVANADASVLMIDTEWGVGLWKKASGIPGDKWQRYSWTFNWNKQSIKKRAYLNIGSGSGVLIDRLQVVEGNKKEYQAPPVMLGLMSNRWQYFVRGRDKAHMEVKVVPGIKTEGDAKVKVIARDAWGKESWSRELVAPLNKTTVLAVDVPEDKLGTFHVELTATIAGKVAGIGLARYAIIDEPETEKVPADKFGLFGICQETFCYPEWLSKDHALVHKDLGVKLNRFFVRVPKDMPASIPEEWIKNQIAKCKPFQDAGIDLLPCIGVTPHSLGEKVATTQMPTAEQLQEYSKNLGMYVSALKPVVRNWEIFNEPNLWRVTKGPEKGKLKMYPKKYFEFQRAAFNKIKEIDPKIKVVCNALNCIKLDWVDEWMKYGGSQYMDIMSFHPYGTTNSFKPIGELEAMLARHGFKRQVANTEKYYGCDLYYERNSYEETRRGYFLPHSKDGELRTAGRSIRHLISHAARRTPVCFFSPFFTIFHRGPSNEIFLYDFFSAYNAATRFLVSSGKGNEIDMGPSITVFVFPDAKEGPLVAMWTPLKAVVASMKGVKGEFTVYDMMGNKVSDSKANADIRLANDPVYLRFKKGTTLKDIKSAISTVDTIGLGDPLHIDITACSANQFKVRLVSYRNKPLNGKIKLLKLPEDWNVSSMEKEFKNLPAGGQIELYFNLRNGSIQNFGRYPVTVIAKTADELLKRDIVIKPIFSDYITNVKVDGSLTEWKGMASFHLGSDNVSKAFNPNITYAGEDDLSANVMCGWNDKFVALAIEVKDDTNYSEKISGMGWRGDSVQLYFDPEGNNTENAYTLKDDVRYTISLIDGKPVAWVDKGAEGNYKGEANLAEDFNDIDVKLAIVRKENRTIYEIVFPAKSCLPGLDLSKCRGFGLSMLINDNDGKGRKTGVTLAPKGKEPYGDPVNYRDIVLTK